MTTQPCWPDQKKIWAYFQNSAPQSFGSARPRLEFLLGEVARRARGLRPSVLNVGAGSGYLEERALERGWDIHCLDPDDETIRRLSARGLGAHCAGIERTGLPGARFDFVVASEVLEHLDEATRRRGLAEVARILRGGGWFLGTVPYREELRANEVVCPHCGERFHRWGHQESFDHDGLNRELSSFVQVKTLRTMAFVDFRGRSTVAKLRGLVRVMLARSGAGIALPSLYFAATKSGGR